MTEDVQAWRTALGVSAELWSAGGPHEVEPDWWLAFSGAKNINFNMILCHGTDGERALERSLERVRAAAVPAVIAVAGPALGMTNVLARADWTCVGAMPLMVTTALHGDIDPGVRRLRPDELPSAQAMVGDAFNQALPLAEMALPTVAAQEPTREVWGLFEGGELVSCTGVVTVDDKIVIWSMSTPPDRQRRGYGRRLLTAVLAAGRDAGATASVLYASPAGEPLYRSVGYRVVEYWQVWSRARWAIPPT